MLEPAKEMLAVETSNYGHGPFSTDASGVNVRCGRARLAAQC
jgi:hypothetical protein